MTAVEELERNESLKEQRKKAAKPLLWITIASLIMMFAGLTSGYVVSRSSNLVDGYWMVFALPKVFFASTAVVVLLSVVMHLALVNIKKDNSKSAQNLLLIGLVLSIVFVVFQLMGWSELSEAGIYFTGAGSNSAGSWVYVITLMHVLHVLAGIVILIVTFYKSNMGKYSSSDYLGIDLAATYWHFVDALWIYLFIFLYLMR